MKLNSLEANAHYDLVFGRPSVLQKDNDGSTLFRFNIEPEMGVKEGEKEETQIGWKCREVRTYEKPTRGNLKKSIIRSVVDETEEFNIVNSYNKHVLGIGKSQSAVDEYKEFLKFIDDLDAMLVAALSN